MDALVVSCGQSGDPTSLRRTFPRSGSGDFGRQITCILLVLIACLGLGIRLRGIDRLSIGGDEQSTAWLSARGLREVADAQAFPRLLWLKGNMIAERQPYTQEFYAGKMKLHHVLKAIMQNDGGNGLAYNVLLFGWISCFGGNDVVMRMLSVLFGVACIPVAYLCVTGLGGDRRTGLVAALLTAVHPEMIMYSQLVRNYEMATCFSALSSYFFIRLMKGSNLRQCGIGFAFATTISLLSHYLTIYVFAAQFLLACVFLRNKHTWVIYAASGSVVIACLTTWLALGGARAYAVLQAQNARLVGLMLKHDPAYLWMKPLTWDNFVQGWWQQLCLMSGLLPYTCPLSLFTPLRVAFALALVATVIAVLLLRRQHIQPRLFRVLCLAFSVLCMMLAAPIMASILSLMNHHVLPFLPRYAIFSAPYFVLLLALAFGALMRPWGNIYTRVGLTSLSVFLLVQFVAIEVSAREVFDHAYPSSPNPFMTAARVIQLHYRKNDVVVFPSWVEAAYTNMYLPAEPTIKQRVDPGLKHKLILQRADRSTQELFDFDGNTFSSPI